MLQKHLKCTDNTKTLGLNNYCAKKIPLWLTFIRVQRKSPGRSGLCKKKKKTLVRSKTSVVWGHSCKSTTQSISWVIALQFSQPMLMGYHCHLCFFSLETEQCWPLDFPLCWEWDLKLVLESGTGKSCGGNILFCWVKSFQSFHHYTNDCISNYLDEKLRMFVIQQWFYLLFCWLTFWAALKRQNWQSVSDGWGNFKQKLDRANEALFVVPRPLCPKLEKT